MYYGAIDLHSNNSVLGLIDDQGQRLHMRKLPNDLETIKRTLDPFAAQLRGIVVESTYNWYWLVDGLQAAGYQVHLANPTATEPYSGLKHSDDSSDAWWLAELLRLKLLKEGHVYPRSERATRDLLRKRAHLVQQRTQNILSVQNLICRNTGVPIKSNQVRKLTVEGIEGSYGQEEDRALAITCSLRIIDTLDKEIAIIEKQVKNKIRLSRGYQLLQETAPGIGEILAMVIQLEAGDMSRFASVGDFASYCRCVKSERLSNQKKKGTGNRRNGNKYLAWAFIEAANFAIRYDATIQRFYQRKEARSKTIIGRMTVAHKLARACYYVLRDQVPFDTAKCFGQ